MKLNCNRCLSPAGFSEEAGSERASVHSVGASRAEACYKENPFSLNVTRARCSELRRGKCPGFYWGSIKASLKLYLLSDKTVDMVLINNICYPNDPYPGTKFASRDAEKLKGNETLSLHKETRLAALTHDHERDVRSMIKKGNVARANKFITSTFEAYKKKTARLRNFIAVQKESIRAVFFLTASQQYGKHYLPSKKLLPPDCFEEAEHRACECGGCLAIPADNGKPQYESLFGTSLERLYYTAFMFISEGIPSDVIRRDLDARTTSLHMEYSGNDDDSCEEAAVSEAKEEFRRSYAGAVFELGLDGFNDREINELKQHIDRNATLQMPFIRKYIYPKQDQHGQEIESSTHFFPMIVKDKVGLRGMSGTVFNKDTFPNLFEGEKTVLSNTTSDVMLRIKQVHPESTVTFEFKNSASLTLKELESKSKMKEKRLGASIIDTTGYIEKGDNQNFAQAMINQIHKIHKSTFTKDMPRLQKVERVVFYDGEYQKVIDVHGTKNEYEHDTSFSGRAKVIAFWDVSHTTGSDIPISKLDGHAMLIVGKHLKVYELAQSAMRLRQLGPGEQSLEIFVPRSDCEIMATKIREQLGDPDINEKTCKELDLSVNQVMRYALVNELEQETENNYRAVDMRMKIAILASKSQINHK